MHKNLNDEEFILKKQFEADEKIIWMGVPGRGLVFGKFDAFMIPFSIFWCGFAVFWEFMAIAAGAPFFFAIFGLPFILVGLYLVFGRFYLDILRRKNTMYALTNRRIFIRSGFRTKTLTTYYLETLTDVTLKQKSNGTGSLFFSVYPNKSPNSNVTGTFLFGMPTIPAFELIDDAASVYKKVNALMNNTL